jgi:hypothetical protein
MLPQIPAAREPAMVPIFDMLSKTAWSPKARPAMNSDIVKPIPHNQLAAKTLPHDRLAGAVANRLLADIQANNQIPIGLPMNNPRTTPRLTGCLKAGPTFPRIRTPAFASANSGMMRKLIHG